MFGVGHGKFARHPNLPPLCYDDTILSENKAKKNWFQAVSFYCENTIA
jgi:GTPase SAR1 family protein